MHVHVHYTQYPTHRKSGVRGIPIRAKVWFSSVYTLGCTADVHTVEEAIKVPYEFPCF